MKRKVLILFFANIIFVQLGVYAQNTAETLQLVENSYNIGNYDNAIYYYQRILHFGSEIEKNESYIKIGDCYFETGEFDKSYSFYELAFNTAKQDSAKTEIMFKKAMLRLNQGRYNLALVELIDYNSINNDSFVQKKEIYLGITYFLLNNFELSENHILNYAKITCPDRINDIKALFEENRKINTKLIKTTAVLSSIIPGLGQLYIGDYRNAANSAVLNFALLGTSIVVAYRYGIVNAIVSVLPWFYRYYAGGIKKAKQTAKLKIDYKRQIIFNKLLALIT